MEEGDKGNSWLIWLIIIPVCVATGALLTKWALQPGKAGTAPTEKHAEAVAPAAAAVSVRAAPAMPAPAADTSASDLPGDEATGTDTSSLWANKPAAPAHKAAKAPEEAAAAVDPKEAKKNQKMGFVYGAISKAAEKLLNNPKALSALLNNDSIVKGFMSRDTVKAATANSASLAAYMKNPANLSQFMQKPAVQGGINDPQLVNAVASSKLAGALLDTPGGRALLNDPAAIAGIVQSNPEIVSVLTNPTILNALMQNPKTAGIVGQLNH